MKHEQTHSAWPQYVNDPTPSRRRLSGIITVIWYADVYITLLMNRPQTKVQKNNNKKIKHPQCLTNMPSGLSCWRIKSGPRRGGASCRVSLALIFLSLEIITGYRWDGWIEERDAPSLGCRPWFSTSPQSQSVRSDPQGGHSSTAWGEQSQTAPQNPNQQRRLFKAHSSSSLQPQLNSLGN